MHCCVNCFSDSSLIKRIKALPTSDGNCDFCETKSTTIVRCEDISSIFEQLFELYQNHSTSSFSIGPDAYLLHEHLSVYWNNLFNLEVLTDRGIKFLINEIGRASSTYSDQRELFEKPVEFNFLLNTSAPLPAENLNQKWDGFADEIKSKNRFFLTNTFDTDELQSTLERLYKTYSPGSIFYRARISDKKLSESEMGKPPAPLTSAGRANPVGIPYLYVSESEKTTLYETRVALHEGITIAKFELIAPLNIISLKDIDKFGPFEILERFFTIEEFVNYRPYLIRLGEELSKPVRKQDVNLDYLPTQFLCEFIKSKCGFDAVEYKSAMNSTGFNLAVFDEKKLDCIETKFYTVSDIKYHWS